MQQTYNEFLIILGQEVYLYLQHLYEKNPEWKKREFHTVYVDGNYLNGLRSEDIEKYLIKKPAVRYNKWRKY